MLERYRLQEWLAFISSGTWSLLGTEVPEAIVSAESRRLNFTNEGGVGKTYRLLKNIAGLWLIQECRRAWLDQGREYSYDELAEQFDMERSTVGTRLHRIKAVLQAQLEN